MAAKNEQFCRKNQWNEVWKRAESNSNVVAGVAYFRAYVDWADKCQCETCAAERAAKRAKAGFEASTSNAAGDGRVRG